MPHILFILVDDMGWRDVGYNGAEYETPFIDELARSGIVLEQYYATHVCSPARAALLTGRQPLELGTTRAFVPLSTQALPLTTPTLAEELRDVGYQTHMVGKWHLGSNSFENTPTGRGFNSFFGFHGGNTEYYTYDKNDVPGEAKVTCIGDEFDAGVIWGKDLFDNVTRVGNEYTGQYATHVFTEKATGVIEDHAKQNDGTPLFLYLAFSAPHDPWQAPLWYTESEACNFIEDEYRRIYCGMMQALDEGIQNVTKSLEAANYLENTIIVFSSDNGAPMDTALIFCCEDLPSAGSNYPLRGSKSTIFEGGIHVPAFIWGNPIREGTTLEDGGFSEGVTYQHLFHISDWFLTLLNAVTDSFVDTMMTEPTSDGTTLESSFSHLEALRDTQRSGPRTTVVYTIEWPLDPSQGAVRNTNYKLYIGSDQTRLDGWFDSEDRSLNEVRCLNISQCKDVNPEQLFWKLSQDPEERHPLDLSDLTEEDQKNYDELLELFEKWTSVTIERQTSDFEAQGLPRFWDCHWHPWINVEPSTLCSEGTNVECGEQPDIDSWREFA